MSLYDKMIQYGNKWNALWSNPKRAIDNPIFAALNKPDPIDKTNKEGVEPSKPWPHSDENKEAKIEIQKKKLFNTLWIHTEKEQFGWRVPWEEKKKGQINPWKDFIKWYFGRNSEVYAMKYDKGITAILRKEIISFGIQIIEEGKTTEELMKELENKHRKH